MDVWEVRKQLRPMVRGAYDLQKLRIQMGLRVVVNFKVKLGYEPGKKESEMDAKAKAILADLKRRYDKITEGVTKNPTPKQFLQPVDELISSYAEFCLISQYFDLDAAETKHFKAMHAVLSEFPIYNEFLKPTKGIAEAMSGVIISEIDIRKARYVSSLYRLAGLDVVTSTTPLQISEELVQAHIPAMIDAYTQAIEMLQSVTLFVEDGDVKKLVTESAAPVLAGCFQSVLLEAIRDTAANMDAKLSDPKSLAGFLAANRATELIESVVLGKTWDIVLIATRAEQVVRKVIESAMREITGGEEGGKGSGRSRRKEHLITVQYIDKKGKPAERQSITFNPFLKSKLIGVLAGQFLINNTEPYRQIYDNTRQRLLQRPDFQEEASLGHEDAYAKRKMIKAFLYDLYYAWRPLEGLPVAEPYEVAKLGMKDHRRRAEEAA